MTILFTIKAAPHQDSSDETEDRQYLNHLIELAEEIRDFAGKAFEEAIEYQIELLQDLQLIRSSVGYPDILVTGQVGSLDKRFKTREDKIALFQSTCLAILTEWAKKYDYEVTVSSSWLPVNYPPSVL